MGTRQIGLQDVREGRRPTRARLFAPLRYLRIRNPEKTRYDFVVPAVAAVCAWGIYLLLEPKPSLFGDTGLLRFARDLLVMAVPFMVGALAAVAMGSPGPHLDRRPVGAELFLDGEILTLRQFVCYLLGYLCFLGLVTLGAVVAAGLLRDTVVAWTAGSPNARIVIHSAGAFVLSGMLSALSVTVLWALYFLTDIVNRKSG